jgi:8-oxo-dGTP pyrophosphatase MutT (NUDIX family)
MAAADRRFERIAHRTIHEGRIFTVVEERFRFADGKEADREIVRHPGAVGMVAHDGEHVFLVRQPREAVGDPDFLEIPAGKLDVRDEPPLETGKRELAEEIGKAAEHWEPLGSFITSVGILDEEVHLFLATGLHDVDRPEVEEDERIEVVAWPLADLDGAIEATRDSKTLIGLLELQRRLQRQG